MEISQHGYWVGTEGGAYFFDAGLADALASLFTGCSVVDLGCGLGEYVALLRERGIDCDGFDGNPHVEAQTGGTCQRADLSGPCQLGRWDWVLSLEVGEHLPLEYAAAYVDNLDRHNRLGIVVSWAVPGQGGLGHFNERTNEEVRALIEAHGYCFDPTTTAQLREASTIRWFANTLLVFDRVAGVSGDVRTQ